MKIKKTFLIYKYTSPSGKCYVGKTYTEERRRKEHAWEAARGIRKSAGGFRWEQII